MSQLKKFPVSVLDTLNDVRQLLTFAAGAFEGKSDIIWSPDGLLGAAKLVSGACEKVEEVQKELQDFLEDSGHESEVDNG